MSGNMFLTKFDARMTALHIRQKHSNPRLFWRSIKPHIHLECPVTLTQFYTHFSDISNSNNSKLTSTPNHTHTVEQLDRSITLEEVDQSISALKHHKSPGYDNVLNECIIFSNTITRRILNSLFNHIFNSAIVPEEWNKGMIIPIYKKGDVQSPSNYRPITLLSSIGKLFSKILSKRITEWAEDHALLTEAQFGFRPTYSTTDANYTLYSLVNSIRKKQKLYCAFIDFSTAFDSVDRDILYDCLTNVQKC